MRLGCRQSSTRVSEQEQVLEHDQELKVGGAGSRRLQDADSEHDKPFLILEAWSSASSLRLLGEQHIHEELLAKLGSTQHIILEQSRFPSRHAVEQKTSDVASAKLQVFFKVEAAASPSAIDSPGSGGKFTAGSSLLLLTSFRLECTPEGHGGVGTRVGSEKTNCVVLRFWQRSQGGEMWKSSVDMTQTRSVSEVFAERVYQKPIQQFAQGVCRLAVVSVGSLSGEELQTRYQPDDLVVDLQASLRGRPFVFGRSHAAVQALLKGKGELLRCCSKAHLELRVAPGSSCVLMKNLSKNVVIAGNKPVPRGEEIVLHSRDTLSLVAPAQVANASIGTCPATGCNRLTGAAGPQRVEAREGGMVPFLTFRVELCREAAIRDRSDTQQAIGLDLPTDAGTYGSSFAASLSTRNAETAIECSNGDLCLGSDADKLFAIVDPSASRFARSPRPLVYCQQCCVAQLERHPELVANPLQGTLPSRWVLLFESPPASVHQLPDGTGWYADLEGEVSIHSPLHASEDKGECVTSGSRERLCAGVERRAAALHERAMLAARVDELGSEACAALFQLAGHAPVVAIREPVAPTSSSLHSGHRFSSRRCPERLPEPPSAHNVVMVRTHAASMSQPEACSGGLANFRRALRVLREGRGVLYRDSRIEAHATVKRPIDVDGVHAARMVGNLQSGASHSHLKACVELRLQPRELLLDAEHDIGDRETPSQTWRPSFLAIHVACTDIDAAALDHDVIEALAAPNGNAAPSAQPSMSCIIEFELIELLCARPALGVEARLSTNPCDGLDMIGAIDHKCKFTLPIDATSFLRPLQDTSDFSALWAKHKLKMESRHVPAPLMHTVGATALVPAVVAKNSDVVQAALSCGGALSAFTLPGNTLGFGAELPAHGCVEDSLLVLVRVSLAQEASPTATKSADGFFESTWEITAKSQERRLAEAVAAIIESQLKSLPKEGPPTPSTAP